MNIGFKLKENLVIDPTKIKVDICLDKSKKLAVNYITNDYIVILHVIINNYNDCDIVCHGKSDNATILKKTDGYKPSNVTINQDFASRQIIMSLNEPKVYSEYSFGTDDIKISSQKSIEGDFVFRIKKTETTLSFSVFIDEGKIVCKNTIDILSLLITNC